MMSRLPGILFAVTLCLAATARAADSGPPIPCNGVPPQGCCDGETLKYCISGALHTKDCTGEPKCGWSAKDSYYYCGTAGAEDNKYPKACPAQPPDSGPAAGDAGADAGSTSKKSDNGCTFAASSRLAPQPWLLLLLVGLLRVRRG
jgi:hypothetical protein